jgi:PAS domain S-box-containing protein
LGVSEEICDGTLKGGGSGTGEKTIASLRVSEELLSFIEQAPIAIALFDRDMRYLAASQCWKAGYGLGDASLAGLSHYDVFPQTPPRWREVHKRVLAGEDVACDEDPVPGTDGRTDWVRWSMKPWRHPSGEIVGALLFKELITAQIEARGKLARSEALFRETFENAAVGIAHTAPNGSWLLVNPQLCKITGYSAAELLTKTVRDITHPDDFEAHLPQIKSMYRGEIDNFALEKRYLRKDGTIVWVRLRISCARKDGGAIDHFIGVIVDISAQKMAEIALRESEERFREIADVAPMLVWMSDVTKACTWFNKPWLDFTGRTVEQELGNGWAEGVHADDTDRCMATYNGAFDRRESFQMDYRLRRNDGAWRIVHDIGVPRFTSEGTFLGYIGSCLDVTDQRTAEQALRESEGRFRGIFEHAATGITILDLKGWFESCNPAYSAMSGFSEDELRGLNFLDLVHPDDREANLAENRRLLAQEIPSFGISNRMVRKDGKLIWRYKYVSLLRNAAGTPASVIALVTDITERKRHEEQINLLMREINHRSKNLLTVVQAIARQTAATKPEDFVERFGKRILALAASQDLLVKNEWRGADLGELIESQIAHFKDLIGKRIKLRGPSLVISASAAQTIGLVVHELATNAGKYGALSAADGRVEVEWSLSGGAMGKRTFLMCWSERGGPPVSAPSQQGFGSTVISRMAVESLDAKVELGFPAMGFFWRLECPAAEVIEGDAPVRPSQTLVPI